MNPYTPEFLLLVFTVAAVFFALPGAPARRLLFASISVGFLSTYLPNTMSWLVLLAFLLSGYGCAMLLRRWPRPIFLTTYLILLVAAFAILKRYDFVRWFVPDGILGLPVAIVGLSYMLFRQIHFVVDAMQGQIDRPSLWAYLNYQLNPFGLLAGPIQRFQDFGEYWAHPSPLHRTRHGVLKTYMRLFVGIIKVVLISGALLVLHNRSLDHLDGEAASGGGWRSAAWLALACYSFMFYLYMNFSGYCDFAIAGASLVGLGLPENFQFAVPGAQYPGLLVVLAHHARPLDPRLSVHADLQGGRRALALRGHDGRLDRLFRRLHAGRDLARIDLELPGLRPAARRWGVGREAMGDHDREVCRPARPETISQVRGDPAGRDSWHLPLRLLHPPVLRNGPGPSQTDPRKGRQWSLERD